MGRRSAAFGKKDTGRRRQNPESRIQNSEYEKAVGTDVDEMDGAFRTPPRPYAPTFPSKRASKDGGGAVVWHDRCLMVARRNQKQVSRPEKVGTERDISGDYLKN
jgi:hypothetical protein